MLLITTAKCCVASLALASVALLPMCDPANATMVGYNNGDLTIVGGNARVDGGSFKVDAMCIKVANGAAGITSSTVKVFADKNGDGKITCDEQVADLPHSGGASPSICSGATSFGPATGGGPSFAFCGEVKWGDNKRACFDGKAVGGDAKSELGPPCCPKCETNVASSAQEPTMPAGGNKLRVHSITGEHLMTQHNDEIGKTWTLFVPMAVAYEEMSLLILNADGTLASQAPISPTLVAGGTQFQVERQIEKSQAFMFRLRQKGKTIASTLAAPGWKDLDVGKAFERFEANL